MFCIERIIQIHSKKYGNDGKDGSGDGDKEQKNTVKQVLIQLRKMISSLMSTEVTKVFILVR